MASSTVAVSKSICWPYAFNLQTTPRKSILNIHATSPRVSVLYLVPNNPLEYNSKDQNRSYRLSNKDGVTLYQIAAALHDLLGHSKLRVTPDFNAWLAYSTGHLICYEGEYFMPIAFLKPIDLPTPISHWRTVTRKDGVDVWNDNIVVFKTPYQVDAL